MDSDKNAGSNDNASLSSAEYRARLLTKLNCLIAVLEVAIAKITRSIDLPGARAVGDALEGLREELNRMRS